MKIACIQFSATEDIQSNLDTVSSMIREAAGKGAELIATPENTDFILSSSEEKIKRSHGEQNHPALLLFSALAKELGVWLLIGSLSIKDEGADKLHLRSYMISDQGEIVQKYDKIHLFDVDLDTGESHRESEKAIAGTRAAIAETPWGKLGMSICYDLRFARLYRELAQAGAKILSVPAAFTVPTGLAHWEVLLRARAIETASFVIAPAQTGEHNEGRKTYGHSMIIGPWGMILAKAGQGEEIIYADINLDDVKKARAAIPALQHDREFDSP